jgi:hypothetical protein
MYREDRAMMNSLIVRIVAGVRGEAEHGDIATATTHAAPEIVLIESQTIVIVHEGHLYLLMAMQKMSGSSTQLDETHLAIGAGMMTNRDVTT